VRVLVAYITPRIVSNEVRKSLDAIEVLRGGKGDGQPLMLPEKVAAWEMDQLGR